MLQYILVVADGQLDLEEEVNRCLSEGWQPQGGVSMSVSDWDNNGIPERHFTYAQAMVRERKEEETAN